MQTNFLFIIFIKKKKEIKIYSNMKIIFQHKLQNAMKAKNLSNLINLIKCKHNNNQETVLIIKIILIQILIIIFNNNNNYNLIKILTINNSNN